MTSSKKGTALVTGASSGIGAIYAEALAQRGYDLILVARDQGRLDHVKQIISTKSECRIETLCADLTLAPDVDRVVMRINESIDLSLLVNNAGLGSTSSTLDASPETMQQLIDINVTALTMLSLAAGRVFANKAHGTIIQIASVVALKPEWLNAVYSASKSYVLTFAQAQHHELAPKGVKVQVVLPGTTRTAFWDKSGRASGSLPDSITMDAQDLVNAALAGLDQGEFVTIPSLPDLSYWHAFESARAALAPHLSRNTPAQRYHLNKQVIS